MFLIAGTGVLVVWGVASLSMRRVWATPAEERAA
jgi:hypothetical protein